MLRPAISRSSQAPGEASQDFAQKELYASWVKRFASQGRPVSVNFSKLTPYYHTKDRHTHLIHFYPAKLLGAIPQILLRALSKPGDVVLDPFCGSGTVPLEAMLANRHAIAAEINPIARLITQVKTTPVPQDVLEAHARAFMSSLDLRRHDTASVPTALRDWHAPEVLSQLSAIATALNNWQPDSRLGYPEASHAFLRLMFSSIIRKKSLADPRIAPPVRLDPLRFPAYSAHRTRVRDLLRSKTAPDCREVLEAAILRGISRVERLTEAIPVTSSFSFVSNDARAIPQNVTPRLVLTSPPYMAAQKYTRSVSLELYWLGYLSSQADRSALESRVVGREHPRMLRHEACPDAPVEEVAKLVRDLWSINRVRAKIVANYFDDMTQILSSLTSALSPGGRIAIILGNNTVCGRPVPVAQWLAKWAVKTLPLALEVMLIDPIRQYGLLTKRHHTAGIIRQEFVTVFRKI